MRHLQSTSTPKLMKIAKPWVKFLIIPIFLLSIGFALGLYQVADVPSPVTFKQALQDTEYVASMNPNWVVFEAEGTSMYPHYGSNALVVVEKIPYSELEPGMLAVYVDREGDYVGHILLEKTPKGFTIQGYNNPVTDPELVTPSNLVGILFATFHYASYTRTTPLSHKIVHGKVFKVGYSYDKVENKTNKDR